MAVRHVVFMTWKPESTAEERSAAVEGLRGVGGQMPGVLAYSVGEDLGLSRGDADAVIVGDFVDVDAYRAYVTHPAHTAVAKERVAPILAGVVTAQFTV